MPCSRATRAAIASSRNGNPLIGANAWIASDRVCTNSITPRSIRGSVGRSSAPMLRSMTRSASASPRLSSVILAVVPCVTESRKLRTAREMPRLLRSFIPLPTFRTHGQLPGPLVHCIPHLELDIQCLGGAVFDLCDVGFATAVVHDARSGIGSMALFHAIAHVSVEVDLDLVDKVGLRELVAAGAERRAADL